MPSRTTEFDDRWPRHEEVFMTKSLVLCLCLLSLAAGDVQIGEVADAGHCPAGETCSTEVPNGLVFTRTHAAPVVPFTVFGPSAPRPLVVGGSEQLRVATADGTPLPPWSAKSSSAALGVSGDGADTLTASGARAGDAYLRITESTSDLLLDRMVLDVRQMSRLWVGPQEPAPTATTYAILSGTSVAFIAVPLGADGTWLADDSLGFDGEVAGTQRILVSDADAGRTLTARRGSGDVQTITLATADHVDAVALRVQSAMDASDLGALQHGLAIGASETVCGVAYAGGVPVVGAEFTFAGSSNLLVKPLDPVSPDPGPTCALIAGKDVGPASVTVSQGSLTTTASFEIVPSTTTTTKSVAWVRGGLGERASAALDARTGVDQAWRKNTSGARVVASS